MNNQNIISVNDRQNATYDIDLEPFDAAIRRAMNELESSRMLLRAASEYHHDRYILEDGKDSDYGYLEVGYVGMGLVFHLSGQVEPRLTDQDIHDFGIHAESLIEYLLEDVSNAYGPQIRTDPFWLMIINCIAAAYVDAYDELYLEGEVQ